MNNIEFGTIKKLKASEVWKHEARDFTPWLCENLVVLGDALDMELELREREADVGNFSCDIVARDLNRRDWIVVIENQYGATNHDHLGKLLTYASGLGAGTVIWIAEDFREEHRQTIDWLNQNTGEDLEFYGVVVEIIRIDDSKPAYNIKLVAFPNEWRKTNLASIGVSEKAAAYQVFFQSLLDALREVKDFTTAKRKSQPKNWISFASGIPGAVYGVNFRRDETVRCEIYLDIGDSELNKRVFDRIADEKAQIEKECGLPLEWERLDNKRASRIVATRPGTIDDDPEALEGIRRWAVETLLLFTRVFPQRIKNALAAAQTSLEAE